MDVEFDNTASDLGIVGAIVSEAPNGPSVREYIIFVALGVRFSVIPKLESNLLAGCPLESTFCFPVSKPDSSMCVRVRR